MFLLKADTYVAIMSLFSPEKEHAPWRSDPENRSKLEAAALSLLAQLCTGSPKGRSAVASAQDCDSCTEMAVEVISSLVGTRSQAEIDNTPGVTVDEVDEEEEGARNDMDFRCIPSNAQRLGSEQ